MPPGRLPGRLNHSLQAEAHLRRLGWHEHHDDLFRGTERFFDCLHDMGDPAGAARHVRASLAPDGTWLIVEPFANDDVADNLNPVGRVFYSVSTLVCTPASLSQEVGTALGAQAGESRLRDVVTSAGFTASAAPRKPRSTWSSRPGPDRNATARSEQIISAERAVVRAI